MRGITRERTTQRHLLPPRHVIECRSTSSPVWRERLLTLPTLLKVYEAMAWLLFYCSPTLGHCIDICFASLSRRTPNSTGRSKRKRSRQYRSHQPLASLSFASLCLSPSVSLVPSTKKRYATLSSSLSLDDIIHPSNIVKVHLHRGGVGYSRHEPRCVVKYAYSIWSC